MRKAIVVYDTRFGNTEKLAIAIARGIEKRGVAVDCRSVDDVVVDELVGYDFIAVGGPTHMAGISKPMGEFLEELRRVDISGKKGFCFDTRNQSRLNIFDLNGAARRIEKKMKKMRVKMMKPRGSALVEGREGPLEKGAQEAFEKTGAEIAGLIL